MADVTLHGNPTKTVGDLPAPGSIAPDFILAGKDLSPLALSDFKGKKVVLNIFPSLDTSTCAASVRRFNEEASAHENAVVLCVSADLPFAAERFCAAEGLDKVYTGSVFRDRGFGKAYGVAFEDNSPMAGLLSRAVVVIGEDGKVVYGQQVAEIADEPDYEGAIRALER